ncbi:hypothetical protein YC2023_013846 [Brassica napus]
MSLSEFYKTNKDFKTRIVLHIRDSKQTVVGAAASEKTTGAVKGDCSQCRRSKEIAPNVAGPADLKVLHTFDA